MGKMLGDFRLKFRCCTAFHRQAEYIPAPGTGETNVLHYDKLLKPATCGTVHSPDEKQKCSAGCGASSMTVLMEAKWLRLTHHQVDGAAEYPGEENLPLWR
ncbi:hypothetical protein [Pantoea allii]|nr:hypothetical protein [Pantoea allii]